MRLGTRNICEPYIRELLDKINAISELYTYIGTDSPNRYKGRFFPYYGHKHGVEILTRNFNTLYKNGSATLDKMISDVNSMDFSPVHYKVEIDMFLKLVKDRWSYVYKCLSETYDEISTYEEIDRENRLAIIETKYGKEIADKIRYTITIQNLVSEFSNAQKIFMELVKMKNYTSSTLLSENGESVSNASNVSPLTIGVLNAEQLAESTITVAKSKINEDRLKSYFKVQFLNAMEGDDLKIDLLIQDLKQYGEIYDKKKHAALAYILYDYVLKPNLKKTFASWLKIYSECCSVELSTYKKSKLKDTKKTLEETQFSYLIPSKSPQ